MKVLDAIAIPLALLSPEQGAAVLLPDGGSAAVFLLHDGSVHAVGNLDPFYGAPVICHGNPGPMERYNPRTDTDVVPYFQLLD